MRTISTRRNYWRESDATKSLKSWLFTILRNAFMDSRRRKARRDGLSLDHCGREGDAGSFHDTLAGADEDMLGRLEQAEAQVRRAMARLRATEREVLALCDARGKLRKPAVRVGRLWRLKIQAVRRKARGRLWRGGPQA